MYPNLFKETSPQRSTTGSLRKSMLRFAGLGLAFSLTLFAPAAASADAAASDAAQAANAPRQSVKLLHVGNSFSNNAVSHLPQFAKAGGKELLVAGTTLGGCTLERHARHLAEAKDGKPEGSPYGASKSLGLPADQKKVSLPEALAAQEWDFVTIQQASPYSFRPESYEPYAEQLITEIREKAPSATILIHQTWPYRADHHLLRNQNMTPEQMYERIVDAYTQLGNRYDLDFLPSGNAVWAASQTDEWAYAPDPDYDYKNPPLNVSPKEKGLYPGRYWTGSKDKRTLGNDAFHLNSAGCYLAGAVWYEILFNDSVLDVDYTPKSLTPEQAADLRRIAHETVAAYRAKGAL